MFNEPNNYSNITVALEHFDPKTGLNKVPSSSSSYYLKEEGVFDCPKLLLMDNWLHHIEKNTLEKTFIKWLPRVTYKPIPEIEENEKYFYIIRVATGDFWRRNKKIGFSCIDGRVIRDVKQHKAKIVISYTDEGNAGIRYYHDTFLIVQEWIDIMDLPAENIYFLTGNLRAIELHGSTVSYNLVCMHQWDSNITPYTYEASTFEPKNEKYLYLSLNRNRNTHRALLVTYLIKENLLDKGLISFDYENQKVSNYLEPYYSEEIADACKKLEDEVIRRKVDSSYSDYHMISKIDVDSYRNTFCSIVSESHSENEVLHISEKTWKPINLRHPFMINSSKGALAHLKSEGFKTFDKWFDESYDTMDSVADRVKIIVQNIKRYELCSIDDLKLIRSEMQPIVEHNLENLYYRYKSKYCFENGDFYWCKPHLDVLAKILKEWNNDVN